MKKVLFAFVALLTLASCKVHFSKTKPMAHEDRQLVGFNRIVQLGSIDVKYMQADTFSVKVDAPVDVLRDVEIRENGEKLTIRMKGEGKLFNLGVSDSKDVTVYVTSPDFLGIELKGSGDFECKQLLDTDNLDIVLNGSGDIAFDDVICDRVNVSLVGSGDVKVKNIQTLQSDIELIGSGDIMMKFTNSGVVASNLVGSGDITLTGRVKDYKSNVRGSGEMHADKLEIDNR